MSEIFNSLLFKIAKHWIAGETYEDAIARAEQSWHHSKVRGIINLLGEETISKEEALNATDTYLEILKALNERKVQSCISIKPTQLGLTMDRGFYEENFGKLVGAAKSLGNFVWVDMEGSEYTGDTVDSYLGFRKKFDNIGVAIQAYIKRSEEDVNRILDSGGIIRLVKGAYKESPDVVFKGKGRIREEYLKLMRLMFERGKGFAFGTHDEQLIAEAIRLNGLHKTDFEFELLMGIRDNKKLELTQQGYKVSEYIPYGKNWRHYSVRRIQEHKSNVLLLARSLVSG